ncbi:MAG: DUF2442 domain-containing protein [Elusimicrobia bacterium]|nr:DUF2442 domain-containing protein [Elusimicrobiota bacterium]
MKGVNTLDIDRSRWPSIVSVSFPKDALRVGLSDGRIVEIPLAWYPSLSRASRKDLLRYKISASGYGIHWKALDEDLSVYGFLYAPFGHLKKAA